MSEGFLNPARAIVGVSDDLVPLFAKQLGDRFADFSHIIDQHDAQPGHPPRPAPLPGCRQATVEPSSVDELAEVRKRDAVCSYQQAGQ